MGAELVLIGDNDSDGLWPKIPRIYLYYLYSLIIVKCELALSFLPSINELHSLFIATEAAVIILWMQTSSTVMFLFLWCMVDFMKISHNAKEQ